MWKQRVESNNPIIENGELNVTKAKRHGSKCSFESELGVLGAKITVTPMVIPQLINGLQEK